MVCSSLDRRSRRPFFCSGVVALALWDALQRCRGIPAREVLPRASHRLATSTADAYARSTRYFLWYLAILHVSETQPAAARMLASSRSCASPLTKFWRCTRRGSGTRQSGMMPLATTINALPARVWARHAGGGHGLTTLADMGLLRS